MEIPITSTAASSRAPQGSDEQSRVLLEGIAQLSFEVMSRLSQLAAEEEMSLTQLRMLAVLRGRRPRMAELAAVLGLDRSSVTGLIDRAARRGLVARVVVEGDGRGVRVELTETGRSFTERVGTKVVDRLADLLDGLVPAEVQVLAGAITGMLPADPADA